MSTARPYRKVARAESEQRTRDALLDAAERVFFTSSFDRATLEAIAREAGTTKQTLLRHFGSKEGLVEAGFARALERISEQRMSAPTDDIAAAVDNLLDHYELTGHRSLAMAGMPSGPIAAEMLSRAKRFHHDWVDHAFGTRLKRIRRPQRDRVRAAVIALCDVHAWAIMTSDLGFDREETRAALVTALRRLLQAQR